MARNRDRSKSRIVKMPRLQADTFPGEFWFELGMIYFTDPSNPEAEDLSCTLEEFRDRINYLREYVDDEQAFSQHFSCDRRDFRRFVENADELIKEASHQLHVGLPIDTLSEIERGRASISRRQGFDSGFSQLASGLVVPK